MPKLDTIDLCTKLEISMMTQYKDMKSDDKCKNLEGLAGYGSPKVTSNIAIRQSAYNSYSTLIETMHVSCTVFVL